MQGSRPQTHHPAHLYTYIPYVRPAHHHTHYTHTHIHVTEPPPPTCVARRAHFTPYNAQPHTCRYYSHMNMNTQRPRALHRTQHHKAPPATATHNSQQPQYLHPSSRRRPRGGHPLWQHRHSWLPTTSPRPAHNMSQAPTRHTSHHMPAPGQHQCAWLDWHLAQLSRHYP